jgi:putative ABC transport system ATP-binding protein
MKTPLLELSGVNKIYTLGDNSLYALRDIQVKLFKGEFVAVIGSSGSGKSTFLHIASLLDKPSEGSVLYEGGDVTQLSEPETARLRNREIGFVFQQFNLLPKTSAEENVALPLVYGGVAAEKRKGMAQAMLEKVGLGDRLKNTPAQLSGGQQQRVAIARALINEPRIIFADEPTGNLDSKSGEEIKKIIIRLNIEGKTVVLVTHEQELAAIAKRVITLSDGSVVSDELTQWGKKDEETYTGFAKWQTRKG